MIRARTNSYRGRFVAYLAVIAGVTIAMPQFSEKIGVSFGQGIDQRQNGQNRLTQENVCHPARHPFNKGDAIRIMVPLDSAHFINGVYQIDDCGFVNLPAIGRLKIDTMTQSSLALYLDTMYVQYLRYPVVQVEPLIRVSLLGGFYHPGLYFLSPTVSLWEAVSIAGGPQREDGLKIINWERGGTLLKTDLLPEIEAGTSLTAIGFKSGDQLWVTHAPKRDKWEVFRTDVLPMLTITISTAATIATLYFSYEAYRSQR
jgi:protein involved in polysaccharide export with SLBB domain